MGKRVSAPPPVNYQAAAQAQGAANVEAARASAKLSNPNINGPLGSQRVTYGTFDQTGYDRALADYNAGYGGTYDEAGQFVPGIAPTKAQYTSDADTPTITQTLTPDAQRTLEAQQKVEYELANLGQKGIGTAQDVMGQRFQFQGPDIQTGLGNTGEVAQGPNLGLYGMAGANVGAQGVNYGPSAGQYGMAQGGPSAGQYGYAQGGPQAGQYGYAQGGPGGPQLQSRLDTSNLAQMPINAGTTAQQAIMSRLDPQLERQRAQLETQLANQGLVRGGEAYNEALKMQGQQENDLRTQAALQGLSLDMSARQQGLGEQQTLGSFGNQAQLSQFGAGQAANQAANQAIAQNFAQAQGAGQMSNQAVAQNFGQGQAANQAFNAAVQQNMAQGLTAAQAQNQAAQQIYSQLMGVAGLQNQAIGQNQNAALQQQAAQNSAQAQQFNQALQGAQFGNTAQQQALAQQLQLRNQPLNEIAALMSGSQIQMPQFQGYTGANVAASPVFQATQAGAQDALQRYNTAQSANNALTSGLFGLGGAALGGLFGG